MTNENFKVLAIDDHPQNLVALKALMHNFFPEVAFLTATDGEAGIRLAHSEDPDIILLDVVMPGMDGFEVCRQLKSSEKTSRIPVIFLTAVRGDKEIRIQALEAGGDAFLAKPIDEMEFIAQIKAMHKIRMAAIQNRFEQERLQLLVRSKTHELESELEGHRKSDELLRYKTQRQEEFMALLSELFTDNSLLTNTLETNLRQIIIKSGKVMKTERTSIWLYEDDYSSIRCIGVFRLSADEYSVQGILDSSGFPTYTRNHQVGRIITASDVFEDPKTREIPHEYFESNGIRSLLDAPIWLDGKLVALLSFEHTHDRRNWLAEEEQLAQTLATFVSFSLESNRRSIAEAEGEHIRQRLASIIEGTHVGTWEWNVVTGEVTINQRWAEILGYSVEELMPVDIQTWTRLTHPDDLSKSDALLSRHFGGETEFYECEARMRHKNGTWVWILDRGRLVQRTPEGGPLLMTGTHQDIQERKMAEQKLQQSEESYRKLFEKDLTGNYISTPEGKLLNCNRAFVEMLGYESVEEMLATDMKKLYPETPDRNRFLGRLCNEKVLLNSELEMVKKDGTIIQCTENVSGTFDPEGNLINFQGYMINITDRKLAEKIQQIQYNIVQAVVEKKLLEDLLWYIREEVAQLADTSNFFMAFYNSDAGMFRKVMWVDEKDEFTEWKAEHSLSGQVVINKKTLLLRKSDIEKIAREERQFLLGTIAECWLGVPVIIDDKAIGVMVMQSYTDPEAYNSRVVAVLELIAHEVGLFIQHQQYEEDLVRAKERAEESDRLKSAFLANMSHEIRTPMNAIVGFAQLLSDPELSQEERDRFTGIIKSRSDDLLHLLSDILEISRIESGNAKIVKTPIELNKLLNEIELVTRQKLQRSQKSHLDLRCEQPLHGTSINFITDPYIVKQVFSNLLDNAIKFTFTGSLRFGYHIPENGVITCFVSDTGIGIKPQSREVIFEHFRQADVDYPHQFGGTGLGLAICKGSLDLLDGKIWVTSEPGQGSTFYFSLPFQENQSEVQAVDNPETAGTPADTRSPAYQWPGKRLLLVEDDITNMEYLKILLGKTRAELVGVASGAELKNLYPELDRFDIVLLDVRLPDADGWELAREIKSIRPGLPVVAQTAYAMSADRQKSAEAGCDDYISKPINKSQLFKIINTLIQN